MDEAVLLNINTQNTSKRHLKFYPLTLPNTKPLVKYFCKNGYTSKIGNAVTKICAALVVLLDTFSNNRISSRDKLVFGNVVVLSNVCK